MIAAAPGENAPCIYRVTGLGTSMWLHNSGGSLVREVALFKRESLWSPVVRISLFSLEFNQLSSQLVKEGRKQVSRTIHICVLLTTGLASLAAQW